MFKIYSLFNSLSLSLFLYPSFFLTPHHSAVSHIMKEMIKSIRLQSYTIKNLTSLDVIIKFIRRITQFVRGTRNSDFLSPHTPNSQVYLLLNPPLCSPQPHHQLNLFQPMQGQIPLHIKNAGFSDLS